MKTLNQFLRESSGDSYAIGDFVRFKKPVRVNGVECRYGRVNGWEFDPSKNVTWHGTTPLGGKVSHLRVACVPWEARTPVGGVGDDSFLYRVPGDQIGSTLEHSDTAHAYAEWKRSFQQH